MKKRSSTPEKYIFNLLAKKDYTKYELTQKLKNKFGINTEEINNILQRLEELQLIDDNRFKYRFILNKLLNGDGPYLIQQKLQQKGISVELNDIEDIAIKEGISLEKNAKNLILKKTSLINETDRLKLKKKTF
ncbi:regulatory protein recX [Deferribacter desulfuricans SSM1]|uniref:Regulatory protein RecX n=1 Tax=Deferribacter desulfuricans (strain DSM 14783 / JCM 11476 / NBRC 101012 / SSM1) TaxID=639282 RepID=D3PAC5_DEFDS|nr:RecX family transcriptional regulator [Deferribacter desulfuricans]BAI79548.1 regulatory protein recX [Deferribacter desulfuricans SSM1]